MKKLLILLIIAPFGLKSQSYGFSESLDSLNKQLQSSLPQTTKYKPGLSYYDDRGVKITLLQWKKVDAYQYRWRVKCEFIGQVAYAWTDDCWIDVYTKKAYVDQKNHKIVYYK